MGRAANLKPVTSCIVIAVDGEAHIAVTYEAPHHERYVSLRVCDDSFEYSRHPRDNTTLSCPVCIAWEQSGRVVGPPKSWDWA